ncbi:MAG: hypothetical protein LBN33_11510 [Desulfovibrio sp.]|jgi:hypothetical protein|nr:hypothetical protein [Desulfovibrio sp.]
MVNLQDYSFLDVVRFYDEFAGGNAGGVDQYAREQRFASFLVLLLEGVEWGAVSIVGDGLEYLQEYIEIASSNGTYDASFVGSDETGWKPVRQNNPRTLYLRMFKLTNIKIDPVALVEWMKKRGNTRAFLRSDLLENEGIDQRTCLNVPASLWAGKNIEVVIEKLRKNGDSDDLITYILVEKMREHKVSVARLLFPPRPGEEKENSTYLRNVDAAITRVTGTYNITFFD